MNGMKIRRVTFFDFSQYNWEKGSNGGCYGFWTDYDRVKNGWEVSYGTTADFEYCPVCGSFENHCTGDEQQEYSCGDYEIISTNELLERIREFQETDECYIKVYDKDLKELEKKYINTDEIIQGIRTDTLLEMKGKMINRTKQQEEIETKKRFVTGGIQMEEEKIEKLYELLENKDLDNETSAALKWAIFELESIYRNKKGN